MDRLYKDPEKDGINPETVFIKPSTEENIDEINQDDGEGEENTMSEGEEKEKIII